MILRIKPKDHLTLGMYVLKWVELSSIIGLAVSSSCALFLWSLERATEYRHEHQWLLFLLPLGGLAIGMMDHLLGKAVEAGNNLIMDEIHEPCGGVSTRMAPRVLLGDLPSDVQLRNVHDVPKTKPGK